jgi:hypothetical protein
MITKLTQLIISGCLLHAGLTSAQTLEIPLAEMHSSHKKLLMPQRQSQERD